MPSTQKRTSEPGLLTVGEGAAKLRIEKVTVYRAIATGRLKAYRVGGGYGPLRVPSRALLDYCRPTEDSRRAPPLPDGKYAR